MSSRRARLLVRDSSAVAAFGCMAISGQVPGWVMALFLGGAALALLGWRLDRPRLASALLGAVFLWLLVRTATGGYDLIVATSSFAALLALQRLHAPPAPEVDAHLHLTGLLMVAGGAALSADLRFVAGLVAFSVLGLFSVAASVLETSAAASGEEPPLRPALPRLTLGAAGMLLGGLLLFLALPRLSWNVAARTSGPPSGASTGFSGEVQLSHGGTALKTNPRPVLRAHLRPDPAVAQLERYWPGRALDTFDGERWRSRGVPERPRLRVDLQSEESLWVQQEIELLPAYGTATLVALETPILLWGDRMQRLVRVPDEQVRLETLTPPLVYRARSVPNAPSRLTRAGLDRYLTLPPRLDPRVRALADQVLGQEADPERAAARMVTFLKRDYTYSLEPPPDDPADPLADFLFVRRQGHCEHFATALAVLLRTHGFATRVMTGFYGGERVDDGYVLRAADAHAWVQVWVPGRGFVTYDATPDAFRAGQSSRALAWLAERYDVLERLWRTQVVDYAFSDQVRSVQWAAARLSPPASAGGAGLGARARRWGIGVMGAALGLGLLAWAWRQARPLAAADDAARLGRRLARILEGAPLPLQRDESLEDYLSRLLRSNHALTLSVPRVLRRYLEARFGPRPLAPGEAASLERLLRRSAAPRGARAA